jgi:hypothetical protein
MKQSTAFLVRSIRCDLGNMQYIAKVIPGAKTQGWCCLGTELPQTDSQCQVKKNEIVHMYSSALHIN